MITYLLVACMSAIVGVVWVCMLTSPGDLLDFIPPFVYKHVKSEKLRKPLYECEKCCSGQVALWSGFFVPWDPIYHLCSIFVAIFIAGYLGKLWQKLNE